LTEPAHTEELFRAVFERSLLAKLIADDERRFVDVNDAACELVGLTREELLAIRVDDVVADPSVVPGLWDVFRREGTLDGEIQLRTRDGSLRDVAFSATANVQPGRHLGALRDLTAQKRLEEQLRQAQKMEAVGRLAGGIAHDFNNLLTAISGYAEFLSARLEDEGLRKHAEEIEKASARAAALTLQLLAFSRRQVLQPRVLDLNVAVREMESMLRRLIGEDVELVTLLDPGLGAVCADPTQIEQVIVNLVVNARDAMSGGGVLTIETSNVGGVVVVLAITDTGVGMTEEERAQLFEPFFTTKGRAGTGLGLATVYGIVEQSGGQIDVLTEPGLGTSFRISLPRVDAPVEQQADPGPEPTAAIGTETILLVEDEDVVRRLVAEILDDAGYAVLEASDGASALEIVRSHGGPLDLLVTDVVMPGMSGPEVAQAVSPLRPSLQVLYMSGYTDSAIVHHGVLAEGTAFLQKPFSSTELTAKVRSLLDAVTVS
jgi:PAS domain S-box-containing protein